MTRDRYPLGGLNVHLKVDIRNPIFSHLCLAPFSHSTYVICDYPPPWPPSLPLMPTFPRVIASGYDVEIKRNPVPFHLAL